MTLMEQDKFGFKKGTATRDVIVVAHKVTEK